MAPLMARQPPVVVVSPLPPWTAVRQLSRKTRKVHTGRPGLLSSPAMHTVLFCSLPSRYCHLVPSGHGGLCASSALGLSQAPSAAIPIHLFRSLLVAQSCRPGGRGWATARP